MQTGTVEYETGRLFRRGRVHDPTWTGGSQGRDAGSGSDRSTRGLDQAAERSADLRIIDNAFLGYMHGSHASGLGLNLTHLPRREPPKTLQTILLPPVVEFPQPRNFVVRDSDDEFPAGLMRDAVLMAESDHLPDAANSEGRFPGARTVIETRMQDATVMTALVRADLRLLFIHGDARTRNAAQKLISHAQADDAAANHCESVCHETIIRVLIGAGEPACSMNYI